jgi:glycerate 2-kinase
MTASMTDPNQSLREYAGKLLATQIFFEAMARIDVRRAMHERIRKQADQLVFRSDQYGSESLVSIKRSPSVIAFGKAAGSMALALNDILEGRVDAGVLVSPTIPEERPARFSCFAGGHPYPNDGSLRGATAALELVSGRVPDDLVIFLISGGGSALFEKPLDGSVTLDDLVEFNKALVTGELPIEQINTLRKHISAVKGGRLAIAASPAEQLTIFISDVPENHDSMVASGPTMPDSSTTGECYALARDHHLLDRFPVSIRRYFDQRSLDETPKPGDPGFGRSRYCRLLSNADAVEAARGAAENAGLVTKVDEGRWDADFRKVARANCAALDDLAAENPGRPVCLVVGGEATCPVTGNGVGGRNQAFALEAARLIAGRNRAVLSAGTDGRDGNSPAAGAVADGQTISRAKARNLDPSRYIAASDSYHFFRALGDTIEVGYTGNNVRDLRLWIDLGVESSGGRDASRSSAARC